MSAFSKFKIYLCLLFSLLVIVTDSESQCITEIPTSYIAVSSVDVNENWLVFGGVGFIVVYDLTDPQYLSTVIQPSDASISKFGHSVSLSGDRIIVGAYDDRTNGDEAGAAYIYDYNGYFWDETKLLSSDGDDEHQFGRSVSIDGNYALVGAPGEPNRTGVFGRYSGAAYLFEFDGDSWKETKIKADDHSLSARFGSSVSINNKKFVIGAENVPWTQPKGAAYFYEINGTTLSPSQKVTPPGVISGDFGHSVSLSGNYAIIGAPRERLGGSSNDQNLGAAHIFTYSNGRWFEIHKLTTPDNRIADNFGKSVDVHGEDFIIGCWSPNNTVYKYTRSQDRWHTAEYINPDFYGLSVAVFNGKGYTHSRNFFHIIENAEMDTFIYTNGVLEEFNGSKPLHLLSNQNIIIKPSCN